MVLAVSILLSGCSAEALKDFLQDLYAGFQTGTVTKFEDMQYTRPDPDAVLRLAEECTQQAQTETDVDALMETIYDLYEHYYSFVTNYYLANIHYYADMTDLYWSDEYSYCMAESNAISAAMDQILYDLAACSLREELEKNVFFGEDFFDAYDGQSLWDETFTSLMEQETALQERYYELSEQAAAVDPYSEAYFTGYGYQIELVFLELVQLRQQIADYAGYDSYPEFAYEFYFYRDYAPEQTMQYVQDIRKELSPLYTQLDSDAWSAYYTSCDEDQVFDYVQQCAQSMGGVAKNAFELMQAGNLYNISYSENKYAASFEVFLYNYHTPYVFVSPSGSATDQLTFTHEFGHFCNDYASGGAAGSVDVAEIFSQGLEYLSLCYGEDQEMLTKFKMADSLCVFVEQAAYVAFEHQVYDLEGQELTVENVRALYGQVLDDFGLTAYGRDRRDYTLIHHFIIAPMYVISYVVSNDVALQIYQAELAQAGSGVKLWEDHLTTTQTGLMGFVEEAGVTSPFAPGRVAQIRDILKNP
jgi:hypothetical protein